MNTPMVQTTLILENLRSAHNVGSILRTANATGVKHIICTGFTPYPRVENDSRDPVVINRNMREIAKTALGAERLRNVEHYDDALAAIDDLRANGWTIIGLEQSPSAVDLLTFSPPKKCAIVVGNEVDGISESTLSVCDAVIEIPQRGTKESLNVAVATGIALYHLGFK